MPVLIWIIHHNLLQALYIALISLITYPEYVEPLRNEIESVVSEHGWTKASMGRLHKMDSFLMEATRIHTLYGGLSLT